MIKTALVIAMVMVVGMSVTAFAATPATNKSITLNNGKAGHTYTAYQIFTGSVDDKDTADTSDDQLTNIQWGNGVTDTFKATKTTAAAYAKEVADANDARATAQALVSANALTNGTAKTLSEDGEVKFENLTEGYYVIIDSVEEGAEVAEENDFYSAYIVQVVGTVTMNLKGSIPTSEKKVDDKNDSNTSEDATTWQDSADYDIGDAVPFQLKATTADNVAAYKKYHITFQDKQSAGLDAPETFTITVPGTEDKLTLAYDATEAVTKDVTFGTGDDAVKVTVKAEKVNPDSGNTFAIKISFETNPAGSKLPAGLNSQEILVNYTSELNSNANIGSTGNPNESYIKYSNNPESTDDSEEGKTPNDKVTVFTYNLKVDKTDEDGNALKGAGFTLYKKNSSGEYVAVGSEVKGTDLTTFTWTGLDDGEYKLEETTVPNGFNKAEDVIFKVEATHDVTATDPKLTALTVTVTSPSGAQIATDKDATGTSSTDSYVAAETYAEETTYYVKGDGDTYTVAETQPTEDNFSEGTYYTKSTTTTMTANMSTTIVNKSGAVLPSTGGMGTTIFYIVGAILVVGAGVILITRRRMRAE